MNGIIAFALRMRALMVALCFRHDRRRYRFCSVEHRSLPRPGAAARRHRHSESRPVGGGDRALHHHSNRSGRACRSVSHSDAHHLASRSCSPAPRSVFRQRSALLLCQRPLALVVVGGILLTPILVLIILPVLIDVFSRRTQPDVVDQRAIEPAS